MFAWLENSPFSIWARDSLLGWPTLLTIHVLATALVIGLIIIICLRLLGLFDSIAYTSLRRLFPWLWVGFVLLFLTGEALWVTKATQYSVDIAFILKLMLAAAGFVLTLVLYRHIEREALSWAADTAMPPSRSGFVLPLLVVWCAVLIFSRLTAFLGALPFEVREARQGRPTIIVTEVKPAVVEERKPVAVEVKPVVTESRPPVVEVKPVVVEEARPSVAEAKPVVVEEPRPSVVEVKPVVVEESKPAVVETSPVAVPEYEGTWQAQDGKLLWLPEQAPQVAEAKPAPLPEYEGTWQAQDGKLLWLPDTASHVAEPKPAAVPEVKPVAAVTPAKPVIVQEGELQIIHHDPVNRFRVNAKEVNVEQRGNVTVTVVLQLDGSRIVTEADETGRLIRRIRRDATGKEVVLIDNTRGPDAGGLVLGFQRPVVTIAPELYVRDAAAATAEDIGLTLAAPPVASIERRYTLDEILYNEPLRARMPRIDIDTIHFETGSSDIAADQADRLALVAQGMLNVIKANPDEMFLVEGYTDAVGSDEKNLSLSDRRAEEVAVMLTGHFGVPAENLTTQGYGKQFLKVNTPGPERANRRVAVRRITPLLNGGQN